MKTRIVYPVMAAACLLLVGSVSNAQAGLLNRMLYGCNSCCEPACCEPACCAPVSCEPACGCEPSCCDTCDGCCRKHHCGPFARLFARWKNRCCDSCCEPACCEPACEPACGCEPACCH